MTIVRFEWRLPYSLFTSFSLFTGSAFFFTFLFFILSHCRQKSRNDTVYFISAFRIDDSVYYLRKQKHGLDWWVFFQYVCVRVYMCGTCVVCVRDMSEMKMNLGTSYIRRLLRWWIKLFYVNEIYRILPLKQTISNTESYSDGMWRKENFKATFWNINMHFLSKY